ncbi:MAG: DUF4149 domain-containing protein [Gemmatimonadota bacterium]|nr:DUF4149 domain-containing protein [Gemmatimonadota bacterium]
MSGPFLSILTALDLLAVAFVFGASIWFFFVQSPALMKRLGRQEFVPLQMRLSILFFSTALASVGVVMVASLALSGFNFTQTTITAGLALGATAINKYTVLPRALRAGGFSRGQRERANESASASDFVAEGAGPSAALLHRTVVVFVAIMLAALLAHASAVIGMQP